MKSSEISFPLNTMNEPPKTIHPTWRFFFRCERLERVLAIMRHIPTPNFSEEDLLAAEVDLNKIDEEFGLVPPWKKRGQNRAKTMKRSTRFKAFV
jgi:hypothetical protein